MATRPGHRDLGGLLPPAALFLGALLLYAPSLRYGFSVDDPLVTRANPHVAGFTGDYLSFFRTNLYAGVEAEQGNAYLYRPLLLVSTALDYRLAGDRFDPRRFHLTNVLLYALLVAVLFLLLRALLARGPGAGAAFLIAVLFLLFPAHAEVVCNVKNREEILALLFGAAAWWVLARGDARHARNGGARRTAAAALFLLALLSKESAVFLLPTIALWNWIDTRRDPARGGAAIRDLAALALALAAYLYLRREALGVWSVPEARNAFFDARDGLWTRVATSARVFLEYYFHDQWLAMKLDPSFSSRFSVPIIREAGLAATLPVALLLLVLITALWKTLRNASLAAFWVAFFFLTSVAAFHFVPLGTAGAFRLMFTPSLGLCAALGVAVSGALWPAARPAGGPWRARRAVAATLVLLLLCLFAARTVLRIPVWRDDGTVYGYSVAVNPGNPLSAYAAGQYYGKNGLAARQHAYYLRALDVFMAKRAEPALFDERAHDYFSIVATEVAYHDLAGDPEGALRLSDTAIAEFETLRLLRGGRSDPNVTGPYYVKALALRELGRREESAEACREGLRLAHHEGLARLLASLEENRGPR